MKLKAELWFGFKPNPKLRFDLGFWTLNSGFKFEPRYKFTQLAEVWAKALVEKEKGKKKYGLKWRNNLSSNVSIFVKVSPLGVVALIIRLGGLKSV